MTNVQGRLMRSVVIIAAALGFGAGCGGTLEEQEPAQELNTEAQAATADEQPRKIDDLIANLDESTGTLYAVDQYQDITLNQLGAKQIAANQYQATNRMTGEPVVFSVKPVSISIWPTLFRLCPNGQWVPTWLPCPTEVYQDANMQVWKNSSCAWHIQAASTGVCTNTGSTSYRYQYLDSWKCGVGTGYCVNWNSVQRLRYDYNLLACVGNPINVTQYKNYLCVH